MEKLKRLAVSFTLMSVLAVAAFAGETSCPPGETAAPPCVPGETNSPPCSSQSVNDDSTALGETAAPPASDTSVDITDIAETVLWSLLLF